MLPTTIRFRTLAVISVLSMCSVATAEEKSKEDKILQALRAAPAGIAKDATVMDWDGSVLRAGKKGWTCYPGNEKMPNSPMCLDAVWQKWAPAWANKKPKTQSWKKSPSPTPRLT